MCLFCRLPLPRRQYGKQSAGLQSRAKRHIQKGYQDNGHDRIDRCPGSADFGKSRGKIRIKAKDILFIEIPDDRVKDDIKAKTAESTDGKAAEAAPAENAPAAESSDKKDGSAQDASADAKDQAKEEPKAVAAEPQKKDDGAKAEEKPADTAVQTDDWLKW